MLCVQVKIKFSVRGSGQALSKGLNGVIFFPLSAAKFSWIHSSALIIDVFYIFNSDIPVQVAASRVGSLNHFIPCTKVLAASSLIII
jgi:hypothetical protein